MTPGGDGETIVSTPIMSQYHTVSAGPCKSPWCIVIVQRTPCFFTLMFCAAWKSTNCCRPHYTASFGPWCMVWCHLALSSNHADMEILNWQLLYPLELVNSNVHPFSCFKKHSNAKTFWVSWNKWQIRESNNDQGCSPVDKEVSVSYAKAACALALTVSSQELSAPAAAGRTETANGTTLLSIEVKWSTVYQGLEGVRVYEPWKSYDFLSKNLLWKQLVCAPSLAFCFMPALGL